MVMVRSITKVGNHINQTMYRIDAKIMLLQEIIDKHNIFRVLLYLQ